jgi:hypothetical protein
MLLSERATSDWLRLIRSEYMELPGMVLTQAQMQRLWGLDEVTCRQLLDELVNSGFLKCTRARAYLRANSCY